mmetsp:Transcript_113043/g.305018  ORF Transcript_113043/g.305018 Transcript_113043/m.305018 type:complete len:90 (+) Transcript_113043:29-298(+)
MKLAIHHLAYQHDCTLHPCFPPSSSVRGRNHTPVSTPALAVTATMAVTMPANIMPISTTKHGMFPRTMQRPKTPQWWSNPRTQRWQTLQ